MRIPVGELNAKPLLYRLAGNEQGAKGESPWNELEGLLVNMSRRRAYCGVDDYPGGYPDKYAEHYRSLLADVIRIEWSDTHSRYLIKSHTRQPTTG